MRTRTALLALILIAFLVLPAPLGLSSIGLGALDLPEPRGYVNDYANLLSPATRASVEKSISDYENRTGNEIAVVTVENLQGTTVEDYAVHLFEKWKIGKMERDNGALLIVAKKERKVRIEVGYGLEPKLTDIQSSAIVRNEIAPAFRSSDFDSGVERGVTSMIRTIGGEEDPSKTEPAGSGRTGSSGNSFIAAFSVILFLFVGAVQWLGAVLARTKSWWLGGLIGVVAGLVVLVFAGTAIGAVAIVLLALIGLLLDRRVSRGYTEHKDEGRTPPWWLGGGWGPGGGVFGDSGGSGGGSGGFGGFGGGDSGGGGASGDW